MTIEECLTRLEARWVWIRRAVVLVALVVSILTWAL
jgi:hypothetical protein